MTKDPNIRTYNRAFSVVFRKTKEEWGGLSNMAAGFALKVNGTDIRTSEALYQACRFPLHPEIQRMIISQASPMSAKMKGKPLRAEFNRPDWDRVRINVMRWTLRVKLVQNLGKFGQLLLETGGKDIVEESRRDAFWGAKTVGEDVLEGQNVLGRLLMELRNEYRDAPDKLQQVAPLDIPEFWLMGQPIGTVVADIDRPEPTPKIVQASLGAILDRHLDRKD